MIYFVQAAHVPDGLIKIGVCSGRIRNRLRGLRTMSPVPIKLLALMDGHAADEAQLHHRFLTDRMWGEWFKPSESLLAFIYGLPTHSEDNASLHQALTFMMFTHRPSSIQQMADAFQPPFDIPREVVDHNWSLRWVNADTEALIIAEREGYERVRAKEFDGVFMPKGFTGYVKKRGRTLMRRLDWAEAKEDRAKFVARQRHQQLKTEGMAAIATT